MAAMKRKISALSEGKPSSKKKLAVRPPNPASSDVSETGGEEPGSDSEGEGDSAGLAPELSGSGSDPEAEEEANEDFQGLGELDDDEALTVGKAQSAGKKTASIWKAPTTEEVANIRAASTLFQSNAYKLKTEALLAQVLPSQKQRSAFEPFLLAVHQHLSSTSSIAPDHPLKASRKIFKAHRIRTLYARPLPTAETRWTVAYEKPSNIQVVGGWPLGASVKSRGDSETVVDLAVEMPNSLFQEKDYLDARFFHKRAFYLSAIASSLLSSRMDVEARYYSPGNNDRRACLLIRPAEALWNGKKLKMWIRIIPTLSPDSSVPLSRLSPEHSNLRQSHTTAAAEQEALVKSTPHYNNDFILATTPLPDLLSFYNLNKEATAFTEAAALLRVWANQRGFGTSKLHSSSVVAGFEGVGTLWPTLIALLVWGEVSASSVSNFGGAKARIRPIGKSLSSYQLFRAVLDLLSEGLVNRPYKVQSPSGSKGSSKRAPSSAPTLCGPSTDFNFLSDIPQGSLDLLREEARCTLNMMDKGSNDSFELTFMKDLRGLQQRFDSVIHVHDVVCRFALGDYASGKGACLARLDETLRKALGDRVAAVAIIVQSSNSRALDTEDSATSELLTCDIGLIFNPEHANRLVDHGPPPTAPEEQEAFKAFWGPKAELRRFNDGRINESVVWSSAGKTAVVNERFQIPDRVVQHILELHFGVPSQHISALNKSYDSVLQWNREALASYTNIPLNTAPEAVEKMCSDAFQELIADIKAIPQLPLALVHAHAANEALRHTSSIPPLPLAVSTFQELPDHANFIAPVEVVLEFERSSRWPDDLIAIHKVKMGLLDAVVQGLLDKKLPYAAVALDSNLSLEEDYVRLEVVTKSGFGFRARIKHEREATLLERTIMDRTIPDFRKRLAAVALVKHRRRFQRALEHHSAVLAVHHAFPAYSHTVKLLKRWVACHWLSLHIPSELVELVAARVFLYPGPQNVPCSGPSGLARCLDLLAHWDFRESALVVPIYSIGDSFSGASHSADSFFVQAENTFRETLAKDPSMTGGAWVVATEKDVRGRELSSNISVLVAHRLHMLAHRSIKAISSNLMGSIANPLALFTHPTEDYDFVLTISDAANSRRLESLAAEIATTQYLKMNEHKHVDHPATQLRVGFDPVALFCDGLLRAYGDSFVLFQDEQGGSQIGGVWNPRLDTERPFRVLQGFSGQPNQSAQNDEKKVNVVLNKAAILSDIARLGSGIVINITSR